MSDINHYIRGGMKVMPPNFLRECNHNNNEIQRDDLHISAIIRLFFQKFYVTFNTFLPKFSKTL
jgi:hypothetical protein